MPTAVGWIINKLVLLLMGYNNQAGWVMERAHGFVRNQGLIPKNRMESGKPDRPKQLCPTSHAELHLRLIGSGFMRTRAVGRLSGAGDIVFF